MAWAEALALGGISGIGSIAGGILGAGAAGDAADFQKKVYKKTRQDLAPWREKGALALEKLWEFIQNPDLVTEMPGYQFALGEGTKALLRSASATGDLMSGQTGRELTRYGQNFATTNWLNYLRPYQDLSASGQNAATQTAHVSASMAPGIAGNMLAEGGAKVGAVGNLTNAITSGIKDYYYFKKSEELSDLLKKSTPQNFLFNY